MVKGKENEAPCPNTAIGKKKEKLEQSNASLALRGQPVERRLCGHSSPGSRHCGVLSDRQHGPFAGSSTVQPRALEPFVLRDGSPCPEISKQLLLIGVAVDRQKRRPVPVE